MFVRASPLGRSELFPVTQGCRGSRDAWLGSPASWNPGRVPRQGCGGVWGVWATGRMSNPTKMGVGGLALGAEGARDVWTQWVGGVKGASFRTWTGHRPAGCTGSCSNPCPKGWKSLALRWSSWRECGQDWGPVGMLMALMQHGQILCLLLAPDELPALIRTAEGAWGDQQGYQVGEDHKNLKTGMPSA